MIDSLARRPALVLCALLAAPVAAQKVFDAANENVSTYFNMTGARWFCYKRANLAPVTLTAVEFVLVDWNATPSVTLDVGIWDEDAATGTPRNLLGSGSFAVPQDVPGWYGARLVPPVSLPSAGNYFVAVRTPNAIAALTFGGSVRTPYWHGTGTSAWTGPVTYLGTSFRVYAGTHQGAATGFGTGKPGANALVPEIDGIGWPNTTNPFGFRLTHAAIGVPCLFLVGARTSLTLPFATIYATPLITSAGVTRTDGTLRGDGFAEFLLAIPNDPALDGGLLASQVLVFDPAASFGVAHTAGLEVRIGH